MIPGYMNNVYEAHASLDHASGEKAVAGEVLVGVSAFSAAAESLGFGPVETIALDCESGFIG